MSQPQSFLISLIQKLARVLFDQCESSQGTRTAPLTEQTSVLYAGLC